MNQTTWIILGGVLIVAFAAWLFTLSGSPAQVPVADLPTTQTPTSTDPVAPFATRTTPVTEAKVAPATKKEVATATPPMTPADPTVILHTNMGDITIKLYAQDAPKATENFVKLARSGFYNGVRFHRVISGFMIQSGDPLSKDDSKIAMWGTGGPGYKFENEISTHKFVRGSLGMANSGGTNTNGSQFFIVTAPATPFLDGGYTNFGEVTAGLPVAMQIEAVKTDGSAQAGTGNDRPLTPVTITSVEVR